MSFSNSVINRFIINVLNNTIYMNPSELLKENEYLYVAPYGKPIEVVKCKRISVDGSNYNAEFEVLTDPYKPNRVGVIERFNHIEIERYIKPHPETTLEELKLM